VTSAISSQSQTPQTDAVDRASADVRSISDNTNAAVLLSNSDVGRQTDWRWHIRCGAVQARYLSIYLCL